MREDPDNANAADALPVLRRTVGPDGSKRVVLAGVWNLHALEAGFDVVQAELAAYAADAGARWDVSSIRTLDNVGALLLWRSWGSRWPAHLALRPDQELTFAQFAAVPREARKRRLREGSGPMAAVGNAVYLAFDHLRDSLQLLGQLLFDVGFLLRRPNRAPWREISANVYRTGTQALGITALVGFLVGITLSYLTSSQLQAYGANIFGISILRELGPLLSAILVAGRSGSSMTAQLGVMRVTQELDALSVMGISHTLRLVLPKIIALAISLPLVILWTNALTLTGGIVAAGLELGIDFRQFYASLPDVVPVANLWLGLGKGVVFGILIGITGCHYGLRVKPNTESLAVGTTASVVTSITMVIIADAVIAVLFSDVGF
jgi:phospholipid/cholesterol/gamma-HCH transport system permease protein